MVCINLFEDAAFQNKGKGTPNHSITSVGLASSVQFFTLGTVLCKSNANEILFVLVTFCWKFQQKFNRTFVAFKATFQLYKGHFRHEEKIPGRKRLFQQYSDWNFFRLPWVIKFVYHSCSKHEIFPNIFPIFLVTKTVWEGHSIFETKLRGQKNKIPIKHQILGSICVWQRK